MFFLLSGEGVTDMGSGREVPICGHADQNTHKPLDRRALEHENSNGNVDDGASSIADKSPALPHQNHASNSRIGSRSSSGYCGRPLKSGSLVSMSMPSTR